MWSMVMFRRSQQKWCYFHCFIDCIMEAHAGQVNGKAWVNHHIADLSWAPTRSLLIHFDIASSSGSNRPLLPAGLSNPAPRLDGAAIKASRGTCSVSRSGDCLFGDSVRKLLNFNKLKYSICYFKQQQAAFHISHHVRNAFWEDSHCCLRSWVCGFWPFLAGWDEGRF